MEKKKGGEVRDKISIRRDEEIKKRNKRKRKEKRMRA